MLICWGTESIMLYNKAYGELLDENTHFKALGYPTKDYWKELWHKISPMLEEVISTGSTFQFWKERIQDGSLYAPPNAGKCLYFYFPGVCWIQPYHP